MHAVASNLYLNPPTDSVGDDCVTLGDFTLARVGGDLCVYRIDTIPGGLAAEPVCPSIPHDAVNAEQRAALALLRAWVNQSLNFAELSMLQPEDNQ